MKYMNVYKKRFVFLGIVVALIGIIFGAKAIVAHTDYPDTKNPVQVIASLNKQSKDYVIIFHRTGCSNCDAVQGQVRKMINDNPTKKFVVIDLAKPENQHFIEDYGLVETPTFAKIEHSKIVEVYHGTDLSQIKEIML